MADNKAAGSGIPENEKPQEEAVDIAAEFAALGKKFAEAIQSAWYSQERQKLQEDIKEGLDRFVEEVDKAVKELRESEVGQKVQSGVQQAAEEVRSGKVGEEVRRALVTGLRSLSAALDRMASSFTPLEDEETPKK